MVQRFLKHLSAILGGQIVNILGNLFLVPIFLAHWSSGVYGEWMVLSSVASYLSTLDLGMNSAANNRLLAAYTRGDIEEFKAYQHSALAFYTALALGATLVTGIGVWLLPLTRWAGIKLTTAGDASWVIWLLGVQILWMMPIGLLGNVYRTIGNPAKSQWITNARYLATTCVTVLVLIAGGDIKVLALSQLAPIVMIALYAMVDLRVRHRELIPSVSGAHLSTVKALLKPSLCFALIMAANALGQQGAVLIVSVALGGAAVASFVTTRTLANSVMQVVRTINNAAWPDLTILHATEDYERLRIMHRVLIIVSSTACIAVASALWFEGPEVFHIWTHKKLTVDTTFLRLFLLYLILQSPWSASSTFSIAINRHSRLSWLQLTSNLTALVAGVLLVSSVGVTAIPIGLIIGEAIACYHFVIKETCQTVSENYRSLATRVWCGLTAVSAAALSAGYIAHHFSIGPALLRWLEVCITTAVVACLTAWSLWLTPSERLSMGLKIKQKRVNNSPQTLLERSN